MKWYTSRLMILLSLRRAVVFRQSICPLMACSAQISLILSDGVFAFCWYLMDARCNCHWTVLSE